MISEGEQRVYDTLNEIGLEKNEKFLGKIVEVLVEDVSKNDESVLSCFALNDDGTVTCPMGNTLFIARKKGKQTYYSSKAACRFCINKCTQSKFKIVAFGPGAKYVITEKPFKKVIKYNENPLK